MSSDEQMAREWLALQGITGWAEGSKDYAIRDLTALLASRALEEAKWWAKNGTHGFITDEAVERITELEQAAAYKVAGGERT